MLVAGEIGKKLRINAALAIDGSTTRVLTIKRPDGTSKTVTDPADGAVLPVGGTDVVTSEGTFLANQYVTYTTESADFPAGGRYQLKLEAQFADKTLRSVFKTVEVEA